MKRSTLASFVYLAGLLTGLFAVQLASAQLQTPTPATAYGRATPFVLDAAQPQLTIVQQARLRNHFSFWAGAGFPTGDFGSNTGERAGFAEPGFTMGLGYLVGITHEFGWATQIDFIANAMDGFPMSITVNSPTPVEPTTGTWLTFWPMTGLEIAGDISPSVRLYGDAMFGMLIGAMPQTEFFDTPDRITFESSTATAFAYGFAGGVTIQNKYLVRLCYSTATPEYDVGITANGMSAGTIRLEQPTSAFRLVIGIEI